MRRIGAHITISGGFDQAVNKITEIGGNSLQIFASSPRFWRQPEVNADVIDGFTHKKNLLEIYPIYFHSCYLINLANPDKVGYSSVESLTAELSLASYMNIKGSVIHLGSLNNGTYTALIENIQKVLDNTPTNTFFIIENAGTKKIGTHLDEISEIIRDVANERVKVCLDTCHLYAAGYDLFSQLEFEKYFSEFDKKIGLDRLELIHLNDSKDQLGSSRDRHENIGEGEIPVNMLKNFINHPITQDLPLILETPGFDKKGPDKKNIDIVKSLVEA